MKTVIQIAISQQEWDAIKGFQECLSDYCASVSCENCALQDSCATSHDSPSLIRNILEGLERNSVLVMVTKEV